MKNGKITLQELQTYFKERGANIDELFDSKKYTRFVEENAVIINDAIANYTPWRVTKDGALEFRHPDYPNGRLRHFRIQHIRDVTSVSQYHDLINELREEDRFFDMMETATEQAERIELKDRVEKYVQNECGTSLDDLVSSKESEERSENLSKVFKTFAHVEFENGNIVLIDPDGGKHSFSQRGGYTFSKIVDVHQLVAILKETKAVRDTHLAVCSDHVRNGHGVSKRQMDIVMNKWGGETIENVIQGKGIDEADRVERLKAVHFVLSEVMRDNDHDLVFPHPDGSSRYITINHLKNQDRYFEDITTLEEFIEKVKSAREQRDTYYMTYESLKEKAEKRLEQLNKREQDTGDLER